MRLRSLKMRASVALLAITFIFSAAGVRAEEEEVIHFNIRHMPVANGQPNDSLEISCDIIPASSVDFAAVRYRVIGQERYDSVFMKKSGKETFKASIPSTKMISPGIEYYIFVMDSAKETHVLFRSSDAPQVVKVQTIEDATFAAPAAGIFDDAFSLGLQEEFALFAAEDVVITASKREQKITESPAAITVITAEDIQKMGAQTISDVLRFVPGLDVWSLSNSYEMIGTRGRTDEGNNLILVLIDGREQNIELFGVAFLQEMPISLFDIKRIEVIRGPGSSLYGANAYSGIINIITKRPADAKGYLVNYSGGMFKTHFLSGYAAGQEGDAGWLVSASSRDAAKFSDERKDELSQRVLRTMFDYHIMEDMDITLEAGTGIGEVEAYTTIGEMLADGQMNYAQVNYNWTTLSFKYYWFGLNIVVTPDDQIFKTFLPEIQGHGNMHDIELQYIWNEGDTQGLNNSLTVGGNIRYIDFYSDVMVPKTSNEYIAGLYLQEEFRPVSNLNLLVGVRYDYNSITQQAISPRAAIVWTMVEDHTLRFSATQAFRKPAFYEARLNIARLEDLGVRISNPDLENEVIYAGEVGYAARLSEHARLNIDLYYNRYENIMEWDTSKATFGNLEDDYQAAGAEVSARIMFADYSDMLLSYSYLYEFDEQGEQLHQRPAHRASGGLFFHFDFGFLISLVAHYISPYRPYLVDPNRGNMLLPFTTDQQLGNHVILNAKIGQKFWEDRIEIGVNGFNLLYGPENAIREFPGISDLDVDGPNGPAKPDNFGGEPLSRRILGYVTLRF